MLENCTEHNGVETCVLICPDEGHIEVVSDNLMMVVRNFAGGFAALAELAARGPQTQLAADVVLGGIKALSAAQHDLQEHLEGLDARVEYIEEVLHEEPATWQRRLDLTLEEQWSYGRFRREPFPLAFAVAPAVLRGDCAPSRTEEEITVGAGLINVDLAGRPR